MSPRTCLEASICSRPATAFLWFIAGALLALIAMVGQGADTWASLLRVGSGNPALSAISAELGPITLPDRTGHDGQLYYLIARDPWASKDTVAVLSSFDTNAPRYRYRRILFPLLAGGFGYFDGRTTLLGMTLLVIVGMGVATAAIADIASNLHLRGGAGVLAAMNIGALVSAMILTPDVLATGLVLLGVALTIRTRVGPAMAVLALAALTKEVYVLVPWAIGAWHWQERRRTNAVMMAVIPCLPLLMWSVWVYSFIPDVPKVDHLVGLPFVGLLNSVSLWHERYRDNPVQLIMAIYVAISFAAVTSMLALGRTHLLRWVALPWVVLAICSGSVVWDIPSNVARTYAILWPIAALMLAQWLSQPTNQAVQNGRTTIPNADRFGSQRPRAHSGGA